MTDIYLEWGSDLIITPNGSIQTAVNWDQVRERIIRRIFTNRAERLPDGSYTVPDYIFDIAYGESGGALIDQNPTQAWLRDFNRRVRQGVLADAAVDPGSVPTTVVRKYGSTYQIFVNVKLINGQPGQVSIKLG